MRHRHHADPLERMNALHADDLLVAARAFSGHPDAVAARAEGFDRHGIDLTVQIPSGSVQARVSFLEPIREAEFPDAVRLAFVRLVRRARTAPPGQDTDWSSF